MGIFVYGVKLETWENAADVRIFCCCCSAVAIHVGGLCAVAQSGALVVWVHVRVRVETLGHLFTDYVDQPFKHSLKRGAKMMYLDKTP